MMQDAKAELLQHIKDREVKYIFITVDLFDGKLVIKGTLEEVLPQLNFNYDAGYGSQNLFGFIWYTDGTWSERGEYDGEEWWQYNSCPEIPDGGPK